MKRKGEFTIQELLGVILAVLVLVLLIYGGFRLYDYFVRQDNRNAQVTLDDISGKIELLQDGEINSFAVRRTDGWVIGSWNIQDNPKPGKCGVQSCICTCPSGQSCQSAGRCTLLGDTEVTVYDYYWIDPDLDPRTIIASPDITRYTRPLAVPSSRDDIPGSDRVYTPLFECSSALETSELGELLVRKESDSVTLLFVVDYREEEEALSLAGPNVIDRSYPGFSTSPCIP